MNSVLGNLNKVEAKREDFKRPLLISPNGVILTEDPFGLSL